MRDIISPILVLLVGFFFGYRSGKISGKREERKKKPEPVRPVCPCTHVWGGHKDGDKCLSQVKRPHFDINGSRNGHEWVSCTCTKYHGPIVINDEFFHPGTITQ